MTLPLPPGTNVRVMLAEGQAAPRLVAAVARLADGRTAWEWSPEALATGDDVGVNRVTRKVPFMAGVHGVGKRELDGLPGVLFDSLPDAWGRLLTDRALRKLGVSQRQLHGMDRLAIVVSRRLRC
jgi:serine/threonine-protein kinase HipA